jgi:hypothetical protein
MSEGVASRARTRWLLLVYFGGALAIYAPALPAWFVADDWDYLILVARARSPMICFAPLLGRFLRPLEVLTYYVNYQVFGLRPFPYHLTVVLLHVLTTWLVSRLAARLGASPRTQVGAALIFLVFAGHSEAVSWLGGAADVWLALFLVTGLLLFARALDADHPAKAIVGTCVAFGAALLAKETAAIFPALVAAFGAAAMLAPAATARTRIVKRTLIVVSITTAIAVAYVAVRASVFGSVFGAYDQLGTSRGIMQAEARAFVLRSFLPPGRLVTALWVHHYDIVLFAAGALVLALVFVKRPQARPGIAFLTAALAISLAPALPLTISLSNTVSERYVYAPTVFSCILTAWIADVLFVSRRVFAVLLLCVVLVQGRALVRANRTWSDAGRLCQTVMAEIIAAVRASSGTTRTLVLNVPDTVDGAYVIRGAFLSSFDLMAPDVERPDLRVAMITSTSSRSPRDVTTVERSGPRSFALSLQQGVFAQSSAIDTPEYRFDAWTDQSYVIRFKPTPRRFNVLYTSDGHIRTAGVLAAPPFGWLDIPAERTACAGDSVRFSGWALADEPGVEVFIEGVRAADGVTARIGVASWRVGTRPDVTGYYRGFPGADRAEWNYLLPCALVRAAGGRLVVRVVAATREGQQTALGTRTVFPPGRK